ncbi:hypothetical protein N431DRAFT_323756 [Stipitochalara longipes BDJ]|nr:hypothetical protein N431DRAFT_323756 [Stipitochalara longipes BDJ]
MPLMETVTIINKSGKVVSTGKHLVNIFKEAKEAYEEKKAEIKAEHYARLKHKNTQKLINLREETRSNASSRHSHRSRSHSHRSRENGEGPSRPPLTTRNLTQISEGSVASSRRSRSSHHGSRRARSPLSPRSAHGSQAPQFESADLTHHPGMTRRHTDIPPGPTASALSRGTLPPPYESQLAPRLPHRSHSDPDMRHENIDMNLAYGTLPHDLQVGPVSEEQKQAEIEATMSKLDHLLLEAHCLQHSATAIIANLQSNPEAMAAVALTLAELSSLLTKMSPGILGALKAASPAAFALLASPQFLIAGGVAIGVTIVMFGGFKIIKQIQANNEARKEANRVDEAMVFDGFEMGSIDTWRRGIAEVEAQSVSTSVDGEFITPEAARQRKERIKERRREEREHHARAESVTSESTVKPARKAGSVSTIRRKDIPERSSSQVAPSESGRSERSRKEGKGKEVVMIKEKEKKKKSALSVIFRKKDKGKDKEGSEAGSHHPKLIEVR